MHKGIFPEQSEREELLSILEDNVLAVFLHKIKSCFEPLCSICFSSDSVGSVAVDPNALAFVDGLFIGADLMAMPNYYGTSPTMKWKTVAKGKIHVFS